MNLVKTLLPLKLKILNVWGMLWNLPHIKLHPNRTGMEPIFLQIADIGCFLLGIRWHIMDVYAQVACIMVKVQHCTFVVQKRQMNILVKQGYQYSEDILHRLIVIS